MRKALLAWDLVGIPVIFLSGGLLHFVFAWSGNRTWVGVIAPVNESVWEHFKMAFWPGLSFALAEYASLRGPRPGFWAGKAAGLAAMPAIIGIIFYACTAMTGRHFLWVDILLFLAAVAAGQLAGWRVAVRSGAGRRAEAAGILVLAVLGALFVLFTFHPPEWPIFRDAATGSYGIRVG